MVITAPGLSSTTSFQPSPSDSAVAMMRARMSGGVLADAGSTIRMEFGGKGCANADPKAAPPQPIAAAPAKNFRLFMALSLHFLATGSQRLDRLKLPGCEACSESYPRPSLSNNIIVVLSHDLDILLAVVETGSMGKAAKRLNISPPAGAKAVAQLDSARRVAILAGR